MFIVQPEGFLKCRLEIIVQRIDRISYGVTDGLTQLKVGTKILLKNGVFF